MRHPELCYTSPVPFTRKQRFTLALSANAAALGIKALKLTCRCDVHGAEHLDGLRRDYGRVLMASWHETIALCPWVARDADWHSLTSYSYDGELAARVTRKFGIESLRGSSSRGGMRALKDIRKALESGISIGWPVDGPKGPRREAKSGIAVIAAQLQLPILPLAMAVSPHWCLHKSWDRMVIPKFFSRIRIVYGEPIPPPPRVKTQYVEETSRIVNDTLNTMYAEVEASLKTEA